MNSNPQRPWNLGYTLLMVPPFIGLAAILIDLPLWAEIVVVVAIIACVFFGTKLLFRTKGGWRPSQTLPEPRSHDER